MREGSCCRNANRQQPWSLEVAGQSGCLPTTGVGHSVGVSGGWMRCSRSTALRSKQPVGSGYQRLAGSEGEAIGHGGSCAAVALQDLTSDGVVLPAETDAGCPLNDDRHRQCCERRRVVQTEVFFVEKRTAGRDRWCCRDDALLSAYRERNCSCAGKAATGSSHRDGGGSRSCRACDRERQGTRGAC